MERSSHVVGPCQSAAAPIVTSAATPALWPRAGTHVREVQRRPQGVGAPRHCRARRVWGEGAEGRAGEARGQHRTGPIRGGGGRTGNAGDAGALREAGLERRGGVGGPQPRRSGRARGVVCNCGERKPRGLANTSEYKSVRVRGGVGPGGHGGCSLCGDGGGGGMPHRPSPQAINRGPEAHQFLRRWCCRSRRRFGWVGLRPPKKFVHLQLDSNGPFNELHFPPPRDIQVPCAVPAEVSGVASVGFAVKGGAGAAISGAAGVDQAFA